MERLTKRNSDGNVIIPIGRTGNTVESVFNRLAAYEDTGMTPEEIMALRQPPNDPLTLEELREMDGEPVWIVGVSCINDFKGHWDIFEWSDGKMLFLRSMEKADLDNYDPTGQLGMAGWLAYRRKPEEEQHYG